MLYLFITLLMAAGVAIWMYPQNKHAAAQNVEAVDNLMQQANALKAQVGALNAQQTEQRMQAGVK